jgi:hypothetical protein
MNKKKLKKISLKQPHNKAKIIGTIMIALGIFFLFTYSSLYIKIGYSSIIIGFFMIVMITEKSIPQNISNAKVDGNCVTITSIIKNLNLKGNAIFIPKSDILPEERVFIPLNNSKAKIPEIDNDFVFSTGNDRNSIGIVLPPAGLKLLNEIENEVKFDSINIDQIEEKLQIFVGFDIIKSISLKKISDKWKLDVTNFENCKQNFNICKQFPCPTCSALLLAITKTFNQKMQIVDSNKNGKRTTFYLKNLR